MSSLIQSVLYLETRLNELSPKLAQPIKDLKDSGICKTWNLQDLEIPKDLEIHKIWKIHKTWKFTRLEIDKDLKFIKTWELKILGNSQDLRFIKT